MIIMSVYYFRYDLNLNRVNYIIVRTLPSFIINQKKNIQKIKIDVY